KWKPFFCKARKRAGGGCNYPTSVSSRAAIKIISWPAATKFLNVGCVRRKEDKPSFPKTIGMIKTGIASYGMSGKLFHAPFIQNHPGYELAAIVERNRDESRSRYPNSKLYRSYEEMLKDDALQLIIVNTPTHTHFEYCKMALEAGKD